MTTSFSDVRQLRNSDYSACFRATLVLTARRCQRLRKVAHDFTSVLFARLWLSRSTLGTPGSQPRDSKPQYHAILDVDLMTC